MLTTQSLEGEQARVASATDSHHARLREHRSEAARQRLASYAYVAPFFVIPPVLLLVGLLVAPSQWLASNMQDPFLDDIGYGASLQHTDCELVIYGDSSAEIGLDAPDIERRTGLTTCNIAEPVSMTALNGTTVLDKYLARNKPPRFLVFYFAPEHLTSRLPDESVGTFEALTYRMRQQDKWSGIVGLLANPSLLFTWASFADDTALHVLVQKLRTRVTHRAPTQFYYRHSRLQRQGSLSFGNFAPADCQSMPKPKAPDASWINNLRTRYTSPHTTVLVDAMAIPECDPGLGFDRAHLQGLIDNAVTTLPISVYYPMTRHVNPTGSEVLDARLAKQVVTALRAPTQKESP